MNHIDTKRIQLICEKPASARTQQEIFELAELTQHVEFFKQLINSNGAEAHLKCCKYLLYEKHPQDTYVFRKGEKGTKFYIILEGNVGVEVIYNQVLEEAIELTKGASFGDLALEKEAPRAASILCKTECYFLVLKKEDFDLTMAETIKKNRVNLIKYLRNFPFLKDCSNLVLSKLIYKFSEKRFKKNEVVYREGEDCHQLLFVVSGVFNLYRKVSVRKPKECYPHNVEMLKKKYCSQVRLSSVSKGELLGDDNVFESKYRLNTCICQEAGKVLTIDKQEFVRYSNNYDWEAFEKSCALKFTQRETRYQALRRIEHEKLKSQSPIERFSKCEIPRPFLPTNPSISPSPSFSKYPNPNTHKYTQIAKKELQHKNSIAEIISKSKNSVKDLLYQKSPLTARSQTLISTTSRKTPQPKALKIDIPHLKKASNYSPETFRSIRSERGIALVPMNSFGLYKSLREPN